MKIRYQVKRNKSRLTRRVSAFNKSERDKVFFWVAKIKRRIIVLEKQCKELASAEEPVLHDNYKKNTRRLSNKDRAKEVLSFCEKINKDICNNFPEVTYKYGIDDKILLQFKNRYNLK